MLPLTASSRILVARRSACPTKWWDSCLQTSRSDVRISFILSDLAFRLVSPFGGLSWKVFNTNFRDLCPTFGNRTQGHLPHNQRQCVCVCLYTVGIATLCFIEATSPKDDYNVGLSAPAPRSPSSRLLSFHSTRFSAMELERFGWMGGLQERGKNISTGWVSGGRRNLTVLLGALPAPARPHIVRSCLECAARVGDILPVDVAM